MKFVAKVVAGTLIVLVVLVVLIAACAAAVDSGDEVAANDVVSSPAETIVETQTRTDTVQKTVTVTVTETVVKSPPSKGVKVNLGEWNGIFKIHGARVVSSYGSPSVIGQIEYMGGADCEPGYIELNTTFFDSSGKIVGTGLWNTDGPDKGVRYPFETSTLDEGSATRAELVMSDASCA